MERIRYTGVIEMARYAACVVRGAERSRYTKSTLQKVYNRGIGAWRTNPASVRSRSGQKRRGGFPRSQRMGPQQWACGRVNSFIRGSRKHDRDLR